MAVQLPLTVSQLVLWLNLTISATSFESLNPDTFLYTTFPCTNCSSTSKVLLLPMVVLWSSHTCMQSKPRFWGPSQYFQLQQTELSTTLANIVGDGVVPTFFAAVGAILPFAAFQVRPLNQVYCWLFNRHILLICLKSKQMTSHQLGVSETMSFC